MVRAYGAANSVKGGAGDSEEFEEEIGCIHASVVMQKGGTQSFRGRILGLESSRRGFRKGVRCLVVKKAWPGTTRGLNEYPEP